MEILFAVMVIYGVLEIVTICLQKLYYVIYGNRFGMLLTELNDCRLNPVETTIISLNRKSKLDGRYITNTTTSFIFPYYLSTNSDLDYGILRYSKAYYEVKRKFKELKQDNIVNLRIPA